MILTVRIEMGEGAPHFKKDMNQNTDNTDRVQAVFFDLFETLITEYTRPDYQSRTPIHHVLKCSSDKLSHWWKEIGQSITKERWIGAKYGDCEDAFQACCAAVCSPLTNDEIAAVAEDHKEWKRKVLSTVDASSVDLVRSLRALGLKVGIISNILPEERLAWDLCPLRDFVDDVVFSCDVGLMKPQVEIYKLACDRLGVLPINACFVGDGSSEELKGAILAGLTPVHAIWYHNENIDWPVEYGELRRVQSMTNLPELLKAMI